MTKTFNEPLYIGSISSNSDDEIIRLLREIKDQLRKIALLLEQKEK